MLRFYSRASSIGNRRKTFETKIFARKSLNHLAYIADKTSMQLHDRGKSMIHEFKFTKLMIWCFICTYWAFMAVHYAHIKTPGQNREVASWKGSNQPLYDASFKY